jgi:hypothetical protein
MKKFRGQELEYFPGRGTGETTDRVRKRTIDRIPRMIANTKDSPAMQEPREKYPEKGPATLTDNFR